MELSDAQTREDLARPFKEKPEGFSFPEDLLPVCSRVDSSVPLITMVNCLVKLLQSGGDYLLLWKLWGHFRATLFSDNPQYSLVWSRGESLVSVIVSFIYVSLVIVLFYFSSFLLNGWGSFLVTSCDKVFCRVLVIAVSGPVSWSSAYIDRSDW